MYRHLISGSEECGVGEKYFKCVRTKVCGLWRPSVLPRMYCHLISGAALTTCTRLLRTQGGQVFPRTSRHIICDAQKNVIRFCKISTKSNHSRRREKLCFSWRSGGPLRSIGHAFDCNSQIPTVPIYFLKLMRFLAILALWICRTAPQANTTAERRYTELEKLRKIFQVQKTLDL